MIRESESTWKETECDLQNAEQINKSESNWNEGSDLPKRRANIEEREDYIGEPQESLEF